jgi:hypothetical protein
MKHNKHLRHETEPTGARSAAPSTNANQTEAQLRPSHDDVARKAFLIYLTQGCPQGRELQHWLEAEAQTIATSSNSTSAI